MNKLKLAVLAALLLFIGCKTASITTKEGEKPDVDLTNTRWVLKKLTDDVIQTGAGEKDIFIQFRVEKNQFNGNGGCNGIRGIYQLESNNKLTISSIASTLMYCPRMNIESKLIQNLESVDSYEIKGEQLSLISKKKVIAIFEAIYL